MDVLIKGLPLPQKGEYDYHLTIRPDGKVEGTQQVGERIHSIHTWAIELPPHGRLVSADEVQKKMSYYGFHAIDMTIHEFIEDELTTVLEAST